jgi:hypothetical protein
MALSDRQPNLPPEALLKAARRLLRPLVRLMMGSGLTFPVVVDALRRLFVDVAVTEILTESKSRTDSRISLLTGVHRKEIKRLREIPADIAEAPRVVSLASQIVALWVGSAEFTDAAGQPLPLKRGGATAEAATFEALVESVTTDVRPRAVLDDLLSHGVAYMDAMGQVHLNTEAFIPRPGGEAQLFYYARNLHDHVAAATANISAADTPPFLDRSVHYDGLTPEQAAELEAYARAAALRALLDVNRKALQLTEGKNPAEADARRLNFGVYLFNDMDAPGAGGAA